MKYRLVLMMLCLVSSMLLATPKPIEKPATDYPKRVEISYSLSIFSAQLVWDLTPEHYSLRLTTQPLGKKMAWLSEGKLEKQRVIPERFAEYRSGMQTPKNSAQFDWVTGVAQVGAADSTQTEPIVLGDQDLLSAALQFALGAKQDSQLSLFNGRKRYPNINFIWQAPRKFKLGSQEVDAVVVTAQWDDRQVEYWLAPHWHYVPVRMIFTLGKDGVFDVSAHEINIDGKRVLSLPNSTK